MSKIKAVNAVMIYASDPKKLSDWYKTNLGIASELNKSDGRYYGEVCEGVHFGIYPEEASTIDRNRGAVMVNYKVDDLHAFVGHIKQHGAKIENIEDESYGRFLHFRDPENNRVEVWEEKAPPK